MAQYVITGIDRDGKRFKVETDDLAYACAYNVRRGSLWRVGWYSGKRTLIHRWH